MKSLIITLCVVLSVAYASFFSRRPTPVYIKISDKLVSQYIKKITSEKNIRFIGEGGSMMRDVKMLAVSFETEEPMHISNGRKLIIDCVNELLDMVNADEKIRPFLHNYPFTADNLEIRIFCHDKSGRTAQCPDLCIVSSIEGVIKYKVNNKNDRLEVIHKEPFQTGLEIISK